MFSDNPTQNRLEFDLDFTYNNRIIHSSTRRVKQLTLTEGPEHVIESLRLLSDLLKTSLNSRRMSANMGLIRAGCSCVCLRGFRSRMLWPFPEFHVQFKILRPFPIFPGFKFINCFQDDISISKIPLGPIPRI